MSTNCAIGILEKDIVKVVYCHYDGYPDYTGKILQEHYTSIDKVRKLIALGDISQVGETLTKTVAYHRDHGEEYKEPFKIKLFQLHQVSWGSYMYIFDVNNGVWRSFKAIRRTNGTIEWTPMGQKYSIY